MRLAAATLQPHITLLTARPSALGRSVVLFISISRRGPSTCFADSPASRACRRTDFPYFGPPAEQPRTCGNGGPSVRGQDLTSVSLRDGQIVSSLPSLERRGVLLSRIDISTKVDREANRERRRGANLLRRFVPLNFRKIEDFSKPRREDVRFPRQIGRHCLEGNPIDDGRRRPTFDVCREISCAARGSSVAVNRGVLMRIGATGHRPLREIGRAYKAGPNLL
ncbi:hypothetical protein KM043_001745 [Ampulex compressa]|nr:hypothetical protein KM043_001745 [Ampulex compressa]